MDVDLAADGGQSGLRMAVATSTDAGPVLGEPVTVPGFAWAAGADLASLQYDAIVRAWRALGSPGPVGTLACGLSGLDVEGPYVAQLLGELATTTAASRVVIAGDDVSTHAGALGGRPGVVLNAGTGVICTSVDTDRGLLRVDGWGYLLGDAGGGSWLGRQGLRAAIAGFEGRHRPTELTERALASYGELRAFVHRVLASATMVAEIAAFARQVIEAADGGDEVARSICETAVHELADTVTATVRGGYPEPAAESVPFTWTGSVLTATATIREPLLARLASDCPALAVREPVGGGLAGAAFLASTEGTAHHAGSRELRAPHAA